jgi:hypothetical protein
MSDLRSLCAMFYEVRQFPQSGSDHEMAARPVRRSRQRSLIIEDVVRESVIHWMVAIAAGDSCVAGNVAGGASGRRELLLGASDARLAMRFR